MTPTGPPVRILCRITRFVPALCAAIVVLGVGTGRHCRSRARRAERGNDSAYDTPAITVRSSRVPPEFWSSLRLICWATIKCTSIRFCQVPSSAGCAPDLHR